VEFRAPLATSKTLQKVLARLRQEVAPIGADRYLAPDLETAARLVADGTVANAAGLALPDLRR